MKEQEAINIIYEGLIGTNSIPNNLRLNKQLDKSKLENIKSAIKFLIVHYKNNSNVPKKLASCFIDIYGLFQFKEGFFLQEKLIEYEDIGIELHDLAYRLFEVN